MTSPGGTLTERLQLVVDATTDQAETRFQKLTGAARETGEVAQRSATSVRDAADRVAAARDRELTATGALRVAETRLDELRQSGRARADQIAAAEEKVAGAQRSLHLATRNTARAMEDQESTQRRVIETGDRAADSGGRLRDKLGEVRGEILALGGAGLVALLRNVGDGFATGARDAGLLATSMNASVEEAGGFLGLVGALGLELNDLLEIQAEFAQKVNDNGQALKDLGVQTDRNRDGTVNWANTLVNFLDKLQGVEDATERNKLGFQFLGEEGFKQLSRLVNSGTSVRDALAKIGVPFTEEDVQAAADYDAAMLDLSLTSTRASQALGRALLPVLTGLAEGLMDVAGFVEDIGAPVVVTTAALVAMGLFGFNPSTLAAGRLSGAMAAANAQLAIFRFTAATAGIGAATLTAGMAGASVAARGLMAAVGGPLGVALIGGAVAYKLVSDGADKFRESSRRAAQQLEEDKDSYTDMGAGAEALGRKLAAEAGVWDGLAASRRGASNAIEEGGGALDFMDDITGNTVTTLTSLADRLTGGELAAQGFEDEIKKSAEELGAFGAQQETAQTTSKALNDLIAEGATSGAEFAARVREAADAEAAQTRTTDLAKAALDAYNATTRDAVQTQLNLFSAFLQQQGGLIGLQQTVWGVRDVVDDLSTPWNEVEEATNKVASAALNYAGQAADAAVAAGKASGTVMDGLTEAQVRGDATIGALRESLNAPGLADAARIQIEDMILKLETAQEAGDIEAILQLTGVESTTGELDAATEDRDTLVQVETRGGPAVIAYLDSITNAARLARIHVESRGGPAVDEYLDGLASQERLAIIRVETRGGPAALAYLNTIENQPRLRGAPQPATAGMFGAAPISIGQLIVQTEVDSGGRLTAAGAQLTGRQVVSALRTYTQQNGPGWARGIVP